MVESGLPRGHFFDVSVCYELRHELVARPFGNMDSVSYDTAAGTGGKHPFFWEDPRV